MVIIFLHSRSITNLFPKHTLSKECVYPHCQQRQSGSKDLTGSCFSAYLYVSFCTSQWNPHILFEALSSQGAWKWEQYTDCPSAVSSLSLIYIDLCLFIFSLPENCGADQNPVFEALYMHGLETQPNENVRDSKSSDRIDGLRQTRYMTHPFAIYNCLILCFAIILSSGFLFGLLTPHLFQESTCLFFRKIKDV